jgi:type IV pilus assembly protein PilO
LDKLLNIVLKLTTPQKLLILIAAVVVIGGGYGYFGYMSKYNRIAQLKPKLSNLQQELKKKKDISDKYVEYKANMELIKRKLDIALKKLPTSEEMPSLLSAISADGNRVGLEFLLFKPQPEVKLDFYAEIPIEMRVVGTFHEVAMFFDAVAGLDRIVNIRSFDMGQPKDEEGRTITVTSCSAATFRYYTPEERKQIEEAKKAKEAAAARAQRPAPVAPTRRR